MDTIVIASHNNHKADEISTILGNKFNIQTLTKFPNAPSVEEDGSTFIENAKKKANEIAYWLNKNSKDHNPESNYVLADDSGLEVDILNGKPGIHSARYASTTTNRNSSDSENISKLLKKLTGIAEPDRGAQFRCVLALTNIKQSETRTFEGVCRGRINALEIGDSGFGYDPVFIPDGYDKSFAQLGPTIKNKLSHRAKALVKLAAFLKTHN